MKRIAIINQRYGLEVNGGSELYSRLIAERLAEKYSVDVLTTCALDYVKWSNHYDEGVEVINNVNVRRFKTDKERIPEKFTNLDITMQRIQNVKEVFVQKWIDGMGPYVPKLIEYIKEHKNEYDVFIVVTYLYYPAVRSIPEIYEKTIFIPTAHREPYINFSLYKPVFELPVAHVYLTDEEKKLVQDMFNCKGKITETMGVGVDLPENIDSAAFKKKYKFHEYLIYVGRIDEGKDCPRMLRYFIEYKKRNKNNLKLVLMGKSVIDIPKHPDIVNLGFVTDEDKFNGIKGSQALILPSKFESLSISVLEAMTLGIPVIVNGLCDVLKGHCIKSNGGLYYNRYFEFEGCINYILKNKTEYDTMCKNAVRYVEENFRWPDIMKKFDNIIEQVIEK